MHKKYLAAIFIVFSVLIFSCRKKHLPETAGAVSGQPESARCVAQGRLLPVRNETMGSGRGDLEPGVAKISQHHRRQPCPRPLARAKAGRATLACRPLRCAPCPALTNPSPTNLRNRRSVCVSARFFIPSKAKRATSAGRRCLCD